MEPEEIDAVLEEASRLLAAGQAEECLKCLSELEAEELQADDRIEWVSLRAWALTELGADEEALQTLQPVLEEFPDSARLLGTLGVVLSNCDQLEQAQQALERALELVPDDEVLLANLALTCEKLRDYERAIELYDRALELGADIDWVLEHKANALIEAGRLDQAKVVLKRYLSLVPDDAAQWITLGILHSDDEEYEEAFACYRQAERLEPDASELRLNWGVTAVQANQLRVARVQLRHLQRIEPRSARPWVLRALTLEGEGQIRGARAIYERLLARRRFADPGESTYTMEMAMDFFARHKLRPRCECLLARAYAANACTVELCDAYRRVAGEPVDKAYWYCLLVEADYRPGLSEIRKPADDSLAPGRFTRFVRAYQVVARNHDEAVEMVLDLARRMGEGHPTVREFIGEEPIENTYTGLYEVEADSVVLTDGQAE